MSLMFDDRYDDVDDEIMSTRFRNNAEMPLRRQRQLRKPVVRRVRREKED